MYVFISHSSKNADVADKACRKLESEGIKCFLAPRDIQAGHMYADDILDAINSSDAVLLLLSKDADASPHVLREIERAVSKRIPVLVYKLEEFQVSKAMEYFLMTHQWMDTNQDKDMSILVSKLKGLESSKQAVGTEAVGAALSEGLSTEQKPEIDKKAVAKGTEKNQNKLLVFVSIAAAVVCIMLTIVVIIMLSSNKKDEVKQPEDKELIATKIPEIDEAATGNLTNENDSTDLPVDEEKDTVNSETGSEGSNLGEITEVPEENGGGDSEVVVTSAPVVTEAVATEKPAPTEAPVITETPVITEAPVVTETPVITEAPAVTEAPVITETPTVTDAPIVTEAPMVTEVPVDTSESYSLMFKKAHVGDEVTFGTYMSVPIEWVVLHENANGSKVLVSKYVLTMKPYDVAESGTYNEYEGISYWTDALKDDPKLQTMVRGNSNWDKSNIRAWLNSASKAVHYSDMRPGNSATSENHNGYEFEAGFLTGFTKEEQAVIVETTHVSQGNALVGGESIETTDKVYLLSVDELGWFEQAGLNMATVATSTAKSLDMAYYDKAFGYEDYFPWWLRDAVAESGSKGMLATNYYCMEYIVGVEGFGIRPAMTVK